MVESIVERILFLLKEHKMTATLLSSKLNMPISAVSEWKKGKTKPSVETLMKIAAIFNVSITWLLTGNDDASPNPSNTKSEISAKRKVKIYDLSASAGLGNYLDNDVPFSLFEFDEHLIPVRADFGIRISGDSMEPKIQDAAVVWVKEQIQVDNGDIGIFILNGDAYCKKLEVDFSTREVRLVSLNNSYSPITIKEYDELRTIGKVL